jgi:hypothetical protein
MFKSSFKRISCSCLTFTASSARLFFYPCVYWLECCTGNAGHQVRFLPRTCSCIFCICSWLCLINAYKFPLNNFHPYKTLQLLFNCVLNCSVDQVVFKSNIFLYTVAWISFFHDFDSPLAVDFFLKKID